MEEQFKDESEEGAQILFTWLVELFESESKDDPDKVDVPPELYNFLTIGHKGPRLDELTIRFLCENGVTRVRSFLLYTRLSFHDMMSPILTTALAARITHSNGLWDVKIYGNYIFDNSVVDLTTTHIDFESINLESYQLYLRLHCRPTGKALMDAAGIKMEAQVKARQEKKARQMSLWQSLGTTPSLQMSQTTTTSNVKGHVVMPPTTPNSPHAPDEKPPSTRWGASDPNPLQDQVKVDFSTEAFLRWLNHHDEDSGDMLDMVMPMDMDLQTPMRSEDKTILSPGLGSHGMDPAYTNQLQNPDIYGSLSKVKQLPMINSKV
jgi:hypothetical protein